MSDKSSAPKKLPALKPSRPTPSHIHRVSKVRAVERFKVVRVRLKGSK